MRLFLSASTVIGLLLVASTWRSAASQESVTIGVAAPLSGQFEPFGASILRGAEQAAKRINADKPLPGRVLKVVRSDDKCDAEEAVAAANRLVGAGAVLVVGHVCYSPTRAGAEIYGANSIVQISPASQTAALTDKRPAETFFRLAPRADEQGPTAARFIGENFGDRDIAILHDGTAYGKDLADRVKSALNAGGIQEVWFDSFSSGQNDYGALATRLADNTIGALFLGGYHEDIAQIAKAVRAAGLNTQLIVPDAVANAEFAAIAGDAADGVFMTVPGTFAPSGNGQRLLRENGEPVTVIGRYFLAAFAAVEVWAAAARRAGSTEAGAVTQSLASGAPTVIGPVRFDRNGDWEGPGYTVQVWRDGWFKPVRGADSEQLQPTRLD